MYRERTNPNFIRYLKYQSNDVFMRILKFCACLVGNSSTGIKECSYFGIPVVNIGTRQSGRLRGQNVADVGYEKKSIKETILAQYKHGAYSKSSVYYKKNTSKRIVEVLSQISLKSQKQFNDI